MEYKGKIYGSDLSRRVARSGDRYWVCGGLGVYAKAYLDVMSRKFMYHSGIFSPFWPKIFDKKGQDLPRFV